MIDILIKKMLIGDSSAEQRLISKYGYTQKELDKIKKWAK
jgi:hypothetical protein|tara:strand:- start:128 stop:247 length:120 start_codon:yes stop_codon:yes gene_type:complete